MNIVLWILQVVLAVVFLAHGWLVLTPPPEIAEQMRVLPRWFWVFLGTAEILATLGLTLPGITRIMPSLVTWAAAGVIIVMVSATGWHIARGEISSAAITAVLLAMAAYLAYGRHRLVPIPPKTSDSGAARLPGPVG